MTLTKAELADLLFEKVGLNKREAKDMVEAFFEEIRNALEVGDGVKPHVLRYWEQEFNQLKPVKRRGNRRYYQHHEVLLVRRIRELLYNQGFTISGARNRLDEGGAVEVAVPETHETGKMPGGLRGELKSIIEMLQL